MAARKAASLAASALVALVALGGCRDPAPLAEAPPPEDIGPGPDGSWHRLGLRLLAAREPAQAERAFMRALTEEEVTAETLTGAGVAAAQQGHLAAARRYLESARRLDPESETINTTLGTVLMGIGDHQAAQEAFQTAFLVSSGTSEIAAMNLDLAERALEASGDRTERDAAVAFELQRLGGSEFRLATMPADSPATPRENERAAAEAGAGRSAADMSADDRPAGRAREGEPMGAGAVSSAGSTAASGVTSRAVPHPPLATHGTGQPG